MGQWAPDYCVYHHGCDDGFGALWAITKRWPSVIPIEGKYGGTVWPSDLAGKNVLFVDFSLKRDQMIALVTGETPASIVVLDHHKTAESELSDWIVEPAIMGVVVPVEEALGFHANMGKLPIVAHFDMNKSGARMAWEFAFPNADVPELIKYIEDRDLWRFRYDQTKAVSAALRSYEHDMALWDRFAAKPWLLVSEGQSILRAHEKNVASFVRNAYWREVGGVRVPVVNVPWGYVSDCANELLKLYPDAPFAAAWFMRSEGKIQWSLRSEDSRMDVSEVAARMGGGGHRNAAGFEQAAS